MKMQHSPFETIRTLIATSLLGIAVSGGALAQGFPMLAPGLPGTSFPGMGMGQGFPGAGMMAPAPGMNIPSFGQAFPGFNMTRRGPNYIAPPNSWNFSNPFNTPGYNITSDGTALYDLKFYRPGTGEASRIIVQARMRGQGLMVRQCVQNFPQPAMYCRVYFNGKPVQDKWVRAPHPDSVFQSLPPGAGFQMQGSGTWQGIQVSGTFQYRFNNQAMGW